MTLKYNFTLGACFVSKEMGTRHVRASHTETGFTLTVQEVLMSYWVKHLKLNFMIIMTIRH